jgi:hypothetical protein
MPLIEAAIATTIGLSLKSEAISSVFGLQGDR